MQKTTLVALYARVSTADQHCENQLQELRHFAAARDWPISREYVDCAVSGSRETRPALTELLTDARRGRFNVLAISKLDRLGRSLKHLVMLIDELSSMGISLVSLGEGIDLSTPAGRFSVHLLAAVAEFERGRIIERVRAGIARARKEGRHLGRRPTSIARRDLDRTAHLSIRKAAEVLNVPRSVLHRARLSRNPATAGPTSAAESGENREVSDARHLTL